MQVLRKSSKRAKGFQQADGKNNDLLSPVPHGGPALLTCVNIQISGALGTSKRLKLQYALRPKIKGKESPRISIQ
jgi:hypothetical protein